MKASWVHPTPELPCWNQQSSVCPDSYSCSDFSLVVRWTPGTTTYHFLAMFADCFVNAAGKRLLAVYVLPAMSRDRCRMCDAKIVPRYHASLMPQSKRYTVSSNRSSAGKRHPYTRLEVPELWKGPVDLERMLKSPARRLMTSCGLQRVTYLARVLPQTNDRPYQFFGPMVAEISPFLKAHLCLLGTNHK